MGGGRCWVIHTGSVSVHGTMLWHRPHCVDKVDMLRRKAMQRTNGRVAKRRVAIGEPRNDSRYRVHVASIASSC